MFLFLFLLFVCSITSLIVVPTKILFIRVVFADADADATIIAFAVVAAVTVSTYVLNGIYISYSTLVNNRQYVHRGFCLCSPHIYLFIFAFVWYPSLPLVKVFFWCDRHRSSPHVIRTHIDYSLLHMYELFTFPFFQILVSFIRSFVHFFAAVGFATKLFFLCFFCFLYLLFVGLLSFIVFHHYTFLRSIASHLIQLNSFSIVFTIMCAIHSFSMFRFTVALLLFAHFIIPKRWLFPIAVRYL